MYHTFIIIVLFLEFIKLYKQNPLDDFFFFIFHYYIGFKSARLPLNSRWRVRSVPRPAPWQPDTASRAATSWAERSTWCRVPRSPSTGTFHGGVAATTPRGRWCCRARGRSRRAIRNWSRPRGSAPSGNIPASWWRFFVYEALNEQTALLQVQCQAKSMYL